MTLYKFARGLFRFQFKLMGWKITGVENIPEEGAAILAANHVSNWDPILVGCGLSRQINFMAKIELFKVPILSSILRAFGAFPVRRGEGDTAAIRQALTVLKEGKILGVFPEGTRSKSGEILKGMPGMVLLMDRTQAPIVPIKVYGTRNLWFKGWGRVGMVIGKPMSPDSFSPPEGVNRREWIADYIMQTVDNLPIP